MRFQDGGFHRDWREKGLKVAMRHKEDTIPTLGSVAQGKERNPSILKRAAGEGVS